MGIEEKPQSGSCGFLAWLWTVKNTLIKAAQGEQRAFGLYGQRFAQARQGAELRAAFVNAVGEDSGDWRRQQAVERCGAAV